MATLLFDGNYFFYKTLYVFGNYGVKGQKVLSDKKSQEMFIRKIATDMSHAIRTFGNPHQIIFTLDSRSWRKDIMIDDGGYKSNRERDDSVIDWDSFYACMNEFAEVLKNKGFIVSKEERAECDDLMYLWADLLMENGQDAIIVSGDKDLTQCVKFNKNNFTVVFNPNSKNRKIVAPKGFSEWLRKDDYDLFDASTFMNRSKDLIQEALNTVPIEEIDPDYLIFEKVLTGDAGDTVPAICTWESKGKTYRLTPSKAARIYELVNLKQMITDIYNLPERSQEIADGIKIACKQNPTPQAIKSRIERNLKLVYLDKRVIPIEIQESFIKSSNVLLDKGLPAAHYDMNHILSGSRFISGGNTFEADIFSQFKLI